MFFTIVLVAVSMIETELETSLVTYTNASLAILPSLEHAAYRDVGHDIWHYCGMGLAKQKAQGREACGCCPS